MNVVVFADHEIGFRLLGKILSPAYRGKIVVRAVVTTEQNGQKWWPGLEELVQENGLPLLRYPGQADQLAGFGGVDYYFLLSWKYVLPPNMLAFPARGAINLHYSLLPKYRGVYPVNWAIILGETETGVTFHWVTAGIDSGPAMCQAKIRINLSDTARTLQLRLDDLSFALFDELVEMLPRVDAQPKNPALPPIGGDYFSAKKFVATNCLDLDRKYSGRELINLLRGKTFYPAARNLYIVDESTGARIYLSLVLEREG
jgi:methionyl-tRNA formyltransferase